MKRRGGDKGKGIDRRGNNRDRALRRAYLLSAAAGFDGNGETVLCFWKCGTVLDAATLEVDRFPIAGVDGGSYRRDNIVPACASCNGRRHVVKSITDRRVSA